MVRIRYWRIGNVLYTNWITLGPNLVVRGIVNSTSNRYMIVQFDEEIVAEGEGANLRHAKAIVRDRLIEAGAVFDGEIRSRE